MKKTIDIKQLREMLLEIENPDTRAILRLRYLYGRTIKEISGACGLRQRCVYYHMKTGREELREKFPSATL